MAEQSSLSDEEMSCYQRDGFFIRRGLFNRQEISHMTEALENDPKIKEQTKGKEIKKVIMVPGKLVNIVVK